MEESAICDYRVLGRFWLVDAVHSCSKFGIVLPLSWLPWTSFADASQPLITYREPSSIQGGVATRPSNMHVLISAESTSIGFCKTLLSAAILGYPTPMLVNWAKDLPEHLKHKNREKVPSMVEGVNQFLTKLDTSHDDDVAVVLEGESLFQLRASTLVDRFFSINNRANERLRKDWGKYAARHNIRQEVLFGAQKECSGLSANDAACYGAPQSYLPAKLYGDDTDVEGGDDDNRFDHFRPRFLDTGNIVGTVAGLRKLFAAAAEHAHGKDDKEQKLALQRMFGKQQSYREVLRRQAGFSYNKAFSKEHLATIRNSVQANPNATLEFGIGLDYYSEISANAAFSTDDLALVTFSDPKSLQTARAEHKIGMTDAQQPLAADISNSLPPFWTFSVEPALPRWDPWKSTPLFTNLYTGVTPAIVKPTSRGNGAAEMSKAWFQKHARTLLDAYIYSPITPVAVGGENSSTVREFWPLDIWRGGARDSRVGVMTGDGWVKIDHECRDWGEELFQDGLGAWNLPENH